MSIDSFEGIHTPICDRCYAELDGEFEFHTAVEAKKDAGWKSRKVNDRWQDVCDNCLAEEAEKMTLKDKAFADILKDVRGR